MTIYYQDDHTTLYHGDCREILPSLSAEAYDLCVTDSAYELSSGGKHKDSMGGIFDASVYDNSGKLFPVVPFEEWVALVYRVLKPSADFYSIVNDKNLRSCLNAAHSAGFSFHNCLPWHKGIKTPNRWYMKSCEFALYYWKGVAKAINDCGEDQYTYIPPPRDRKHTTEKPIPLLKKYIRNSSQPGDTVLDPFAGSGTTLLAARQLGRKGVGIEIQENYCNIIVQRIRNVSTEIHETQTSMAMY